MKKTPQDVWPMKNSSPIKKTGPAIDDKGPGAVSSAPTSKAKAPALA